MHAYSDSNKETEAGGSPWLEVGLGNIERPSLKNITSKKDRECLEMTCFPLFPMIFSNLS